MILHTIVCEVCSTNLVKAELISLKRPLDSTMFKPLDENFPFPWPGPAIPWNWLQCPYCHLRPFILTDEQVHASVQGQWPGPERVKTTKGWYTIYSGEFPGVPPQINVQLHTNEELEAAWKERELEKKGKAELAKAKARQKESITKPKSGSGSGGKKPSKRK